MYLNSNMYIFFTKIYSSIMSKIGYSEFMFWKYQQYKVEKQFYLIGYDDNYTKWYDATDSIMYVYSII